MSGTNHENKGSNTTRRGIIKSSDSVEGDSNGCEGDNGDCDLDDDGIICHASCDGLFRNFFVDLKERDYS